MSGIIDEGAPWNARAPRWFWMVAWAWLLWNLPGAVGFVLGDLRLHAGATPLPGPAALWTPLPGWMRCGQALAVGGGLAGSLLMLGRIRHAAVAYALSFAGAAGVLAWRYAHGALATEPGFAAAALTMLGGTLGQLWLSRRFFWQGLLR